MAGAVGGLLDDPLEAVLIDQFGAPVLPLAKAFSNRNAGLVRPQVASLWKVARDVTALLGRQTPAVAAGQRRERRRIGRTYGHMGFSQVMNSI